MRQRANPPVPIQRVNCAKSKNPCECPKAGPPICVQFNSCRKHGNQIARVALLLFFFGLAVISGKIQRVFAKSIHFFHIEGKKTVLGWLSWLRAVLLFSDELAVAW